MLLNRLFKRTKHQNGLRFSLLKMFSQKMPYFREMGTQLNITIPKLNEQLTIENGRKCLVYGIKAVSAEQWNAINQNKNEKQKEGYFDQKQLICFKVDKNSREILQFDTVKKIAENLQLDICLMQQNTSTSSEAENIAQNEQQNETIQNISQQPSTILTLSKFREYIYRQYYTKELKNKSKKKYLENQLHNQLVAKINNSKPKKGSDKNKIKSIRIGEDVHSNDLKNKQNQVNNWLQQGQTIIKVIAHNDSNKSKKALEKFISMFDKQVEIIEESFTPDPKKRPITRLYALLEFDNQIEIDFDFINRRWRRRQAEIKIAKEGIKNKSSVFDIDFSKQGEQIQKAYLAAFDEAGIPYPKEFDYLKKIDKQIQKQGLMGFIRSTVKQTQEKIQKGQFEDQNLTEQEQKIRDRENRKIMEIRTVEDIIQEMEEMKSRQYEMEQYEATRYKELQAQLTEMLKNARKYAQN